MIEVENIKKGYVHQFEDADKNPVFPVTVTDAVVNPKTGKTIEVTLDEEIEKVEQEFQNNEGAPSDLPDPEGSRWARFNEYERLRGDGLKYKEDLFIDSNNEVKLANRDNTNGMSYVILRKNKSFAEQVTKENTIYEIRYNFDLNSEEVTIPEGCVLAFDGGSLINGTVVGNYSGVEAGLVKIFDNITILGTWILNSFEALWFGAKADMTTDNTDVIQYIINNVPEFSNIHISPNILYNYNNIDLSNIDNFVINDESGYDPRVGVFSSVKKLYFKAEDPGHKDSNGLVVNSPWHPWIGVNSQGGEYMCSFSFLHDGSCFSDINLAPYSPEGRNCKIISFRNIINGKIRPYLQALGGPNGNNELGFNMIPSVGTECNWGVYGIDKGLIHQYFSGLNKDLTFIFNNKKETDNVISNREIWRIVFGTNGTIIFKNTENNKRIVFKNNGNCAASGLSIEQNNVEYFKIEPSEYTSGKKNYILLSVKGNIGSPASLKNFIQIFGGKDGNNEIGINTIPSKGYECKFASATADKTLNIGFCGGQEKDIFFDFNSKDSSGNNIELWSIAFLKAGKIIFKNKLHNGKDIIFNQDGTIQTTAYTCNGDPNSLNLTPRYIGEEVLDTSANTWYKSYGTGVGQWKAITN